MTHIAICGYCGVGVSSVADEALSTEAAVDHFQTRHPAQEWSLVSWPDGRLVLLELPEDGVW